MYRRVRTKTNRNEEKVRIRMKTEEKMDALMNDEEFNAAFARVKNAEDIVALYGRYGIEVPAEIAQELFEQVPAEDGELLESDLENVAGGAIHFAGIGRAVVYGCTYVFSRLSGKSPSASKKAAGKAAEEAFKTGHTRPGF